MTPGFQLRNPQDSGFHLSASYWESPKRLEAGGAVLAARRAGEWTFRPRLLTVVHYPPPPFQNPLFVEAEKKVSYNCCSQGTIGLQIRMEKNSFTPGERVVFTTEVSNQTGKCIKAVVFALYAHVQYRGFTPKAEQRARVDSSTLLRQEANTHIAPFNTAKIVSTFGLPPVLSVSSTMADSEIMSTQYELVGTVHLPWSLTCVKARVPIIITRTALDSDSCQPQEGAGGLVREDCQD